MNIDLGCDQKFVASEGLRLTQIRPVFDKP